jgi:hypothetical protein
VQLVELEAGEIGDEVRLPDIERRSAGPDHRHVLALPFPMARRADALRERAGIIEHETDIVIEIERQGRVVGA